MTGSKPHLARFLPFLDLRGYDPRWLAGDLVAALAVVFVAIPQGAAYALIAGPPPEAGLYAAAFPAAVGSFLRSSPFVVTGPTNAVSLVVGSAVAATAARSGVSPMEIGIALALLVGAIQLGAGLLRLDVVAYYVSTPVLLGYLTGAAVREVSPDAAGADRGCPAIRILNVTGPLLRRPGSSNRRSRSLPAIETFACWSCAFAKPALDVTIASSLETSSQRLRREGRTLVLVGLSPRMADLFVRTGIGERIGQENLFPVEDDWRSAMEPALRRALSLAGTHACGARCPFALYLNREGDDRIPVRREEASVNMQNAGMRGARHRRRRVGGRRRWRPSAP